ncbi:hypothetical protein GCM10009118_16180 [Wandonia haliotis]|uniref:Uncharacterized protein n=1 Tax=Wandonia haliotis TaxID=574963 RepID=A0ABN1MQ74_9FLAO
MKLTFKTLAFLVVISAFTSSCGNSDGNDENHDGHEHHDSHDHEHNHNEKEGHTH